MPVAILSHGQEGTVQEYAIFAPSRTQRGDMLVVREIKKEMSCEGEIRVQGWKREISCNFYIYAQVK